MTRKRFIKRYMSYGYSRDKANYMAQHALWKFGCYETYYNSIESRIDRNIEKTTKGLFEQWEEIRKTAQIMGLRLSSNLSDKMQQINQALNLM